jgi:molybdopterin-binding protein
MRRPEAAGPKLLKAVDALELAADQVAVAVIKASDVMVGVE